jgi:hypothetical protein
VPGHANGKVGKIAADVVAISMQVTDLAPVANAPANELALCTPSLTPSFDECRLSNMLPCELQVDTLQLGASNDGKLACGDCHDCIKMDANRASLRAIVAAYYPDIHDLMVRSSDREATHKQLLQQHEAKMSANGATGSCQCTMTAEKAHFFALAQGQILQDIVDEHLTMYIKLSTMRDAEAVDVPREMHSNSVCRLGKYLRQL